MIGEPPMMQDRLGQRGTMRRIACSIALAALCLSGCATQSAKCPPPTMEQKNAAALSAIGQTFEPRVGGHQFAAQTSTRDGDGNLVITYQRIGFASQAQTSAPDRLVIVLERCTGKLLRFYQP